MGATGDVHSARVAAPLDLSDFEAIFRVLPSPYMLLDRDLRYVDANAAYCAAVERSREELLGRNLFELFPNDGPSGQRLRQSFERVIATGQPDSIPLLPYPIPRPESRGGGFEMRFWSAAHVPLLDPAGRTRFVIQNTVDVTELQQLRTIAYGPGGDGPAPGETDLLQRAREAEALNRSLTRETQGLRDLFMQAPGFMAVLTGEEHTFALVNNAYQQLIGHRAVIGRPVGDALPEVVGQGFLKLLTQVRETREPFIGEAVSVRLTRSPGAQPEERFVDFIYQPILSPEGEAWGVFVEGSDVTDRVVAERQQKLLVDELNHRVKNTLATVQAIAAQTLRSSPEPAEFRQAFESRLLALSATHDLLTASSWRSAPLREVLLNEFRPYDPGRYRLSGEDTALSPREALVLGLLLHELATNAAKYGALSVDRGCVLVDWRVEGGKLLLDWRETGGPPVTLPTRRGFGSRLIERGLRELGGHAAIHYDQTGVRCSLTIDLHADA